MAYSIIEQLEQAKGPLSVQQLAKIYGVSKQAIYKAKELGRLTPIDIGLDVVRFDPHTLIRQLRENNPSLRKAARP